MVWQTLSANWGTLAEKLRRRYPALEPSAIGPDTDAQVLVRQLADAHELTLHEAREELEHFLTLEALARRAEVYQE